MRRAILYTIHDDAGEGHGDAGIEFMGSLEFLIGFDRPPFGGFLFGNEGLDVAIGDTPVHGGAKIEDVGGWGERSAADLFGGDVVRGALDAGFNGTDGTGLAEVDDFGFVLLVDEDVVGFDIGVDVTNAVHGGESTSDLDEDVDEGGEVVGTLDVEGLAVEEFHEEIELGDFEHFPFADHADAFAEGGVVELGGDGEFLFGLLEEAVVVGGLSEDAF